MTATNALGPVAFTQDSMGNTVTYAISGYPVVGYGYDAFNRMSTLTQGGANLATYGYNAYGERSSKQAAQGVFRYSYVDGTHQLLAEHQDSPDLWTNYLWFGGQPIGILRGTSLYYLHNDYLGRPELATNSARTVVWQAANGAFGQHTIALDSIGGINIEFPGQYFDKESNLSYNMSRYYDPLYGRYTQADPIGLAGGINPYVYVGGNPVMMVDPDGHQLVPALGVGAVLIGWYWYDQYGKVNNARELKNNAANALISAKQMGELNDQLYDCMSNNNCSEDACVTDDKRIGALKTSLESLRSAGGNAAEISIDSYTNGLPDQLDLREALQKK